MTISFTELGSGLYIVTLNGFDIATYATEAEARALAVILEQAYPPFVVSYRHDYIISVEEDGIVPTPVPIPTPTPTNQVFRDTFDYVVDRNVAGAEAIFQAHGWVGCKTQQDTTRHPNGYIYTVDAIPNQTPITGRALCLEALPTTLGGQTDFYLEGGALPANVWFRFNLFINHVPGQESIMDEQKFIYACNGDYPCHDYRWMLSLATNSADPLWQTVDGSQGDCFLNLSANPTYSADTVTNAASTNVGYEWRMGQNNLTERVRPNRWQEITLHIDTSTNNGIYEAWINDVKVAEYISGQNGFQWNIPAPSGHAHFRMPTTVGRTSGGPDNWMYLQNFRIAESKGSL